MLTPTGINKTAAAVLGLISHATYTLGGVTSTAAIYKTEVEQNVLKVYLFLNEAAAGQLTNFKLIDKDGEVFADRPDNITKPSTKGMWVMFKFAIVEV